MELQVVFSTALGLLTHSGQVMRKFHFAVSVILFSCCAGIATAQVQPGLRNFSAYDAHEVDTVNLMNNNVTLKLPFYYKPGLLPVQIGMFGNYYVSAPSSTWQPSVTSLPPTISVAGTLSAGSTGYLSWSGGSQICPNGTDHTQVYSQWAIITSDGAWHALNPTLQTDRIMSGPNTGQSCLSSGFTASPLDGTKLTMTAPSNAWSLALPTIYTTSGYIVTGLETGLVTPSITDSNGNKVSGTTAITDSFGMTAATITSPTAGPVSWNDVKAGTPQVSLSTSNLTLRSNFACTSPSIAEYNNTSATALPTTINYPDGTTLGISYETTPSYSPKVTGRLYQITLREGGTIKYTYGGGHNGIDCTYQTVPTLTRTLGNGDVTTYSLAYSLISGSNYKAVNTMIDPGGNETDYTFTGFASGGYSATYGQVLTQIKKNQGNCATSCTLLETDLISYNSTYTSTPSASTIANAQVTLPITKKIVYRQLSGMSNWSAVETHYDTYDDVTYTAQYDFGGSSPARATTITYGSCTANCTTTSPTISNTAMAANFIFNRPGSVVTTQNGSTVAQTNYTYDSTGKGNLTSAQYWNGSSFIGQTTSNVINSNGTPSKTYDVGNHETDYYYVSTSYTDINGCSAMTQTPFPTKITNVSVSLSTQFTYDCVGGVKLSQTDANGNVTNDGYVEIDGTTAEPWWRLSKVTDPYSTVSAYGYAPASSTFYYTSFNSGNSLDNAGTENDAYGRPANWQKVQGPSSSTYDTISTTYGWSGNYFQTTTSQPCAASLNSTCTAAHTSQFDAMGRLYTEVTTSNETITHTYNQNDDLVVLTPAPTGETTAGKQIQTEYDGLGRVSKVCHIGSTASTGSGTTCGQHYNSSATGATDAYSYGQGTGYTTVSIARGSQTRTFTFDALGRMTQKQTPEGGTWHYYYDSYSGSCGQSGSHNGVMTCSIDPNGYTVLFYYDGLARLTDEGQAAGTSNATCKRFRYDSSSGILGSLPTGVSLSNQYGRMVEAETDDCTYPVTLAHQFTDEWFAYDKDGRATDVWQSSPHSTQYYHSVGTFFENGAVKTLALSSPSLYTMTYTIDGEGRPNSAEAGTTTMVYGTTFNAASQPTAVNLIAASSDNDSYSYDQYTGRMTGYTFTVGATPKSLTGTLTWNPNGTLSKIATTDGFNAGGSLTCVSNSTGSLGYGYDDWTRLSTFDCGSGNWGQNFTYDVYDNMSKNVITGRTGTSWSPTYSSLTNHFTPGTFDSDGNTTSDGSGSNYWGWNEYSKMAWYSNSAIAPTCGTNGQCATYDAFGRMVEYSAGATWKETWYTQAGTVNMSGTTANFAYWPAAAGKVIVTGNLGTIAYAHNDWLGNARAISTHGRTVPQEQAYTPYGEIFAQFGTTASQLEEFAGITGNFNNGIQWDTPNRDLGIFGRWLSPDPAGQGWNQYAYPTNPNTFVDPSGLIMKVGCAGELHPSMDPFCSGGGPGGGGGGGGGGGCIVDGVASDCGGLLGSNGIVECPNDVCNGFTNSGQYFQFVAGAGGAQGYLLFSDILNGINEVNGTFMSNAQFQAYLAQTYAAQILAQFNRLLGNLPAGASIAYDPNNPDVNGGHANFAYSCPADSWSSCGPGRYDDGVHVECASGATNCAAGSPLVAHDDTVSPWVSPASFSFSTLFTANFWEHGFVDLIYGQMCGCVFSQ